MTREEALDILTHNWTRLENPNYEESELDKAYYMAIEALSEPKNEVRVQEGYCKGANCKWWNPQLNGCNRCVMIQDEYTHPSAEPSKVDFRTDKSANICTEVNDLISREDAVKAVARYMMDDALIDSNYASEDINDWIEIGQSILEDVPTADRPTGVWHDSFGFSHCSLCGFGVPRPIDKQTNFNYCPKCGARLEVAE